MKARIKLVGLLAALALAALALPAVAHDGSGGHTDISLACTNTPTTAGAVATSSCTFDFNDGGSFGNTSNDRVDKFELVLPLSVVLNEAGSRDAATDPSDGEKVGESTVRTELAWNACDDANNDGGTYPTNWERELDWTAYSETGWTKVAQYTTVFTVLFFFTDLVPSHVLKNDSTGQYKVVTDLPQDRGCDGAHTKFNPMTLWGYAQNNSSQEWVGKNPTPAGNYTVKVKAFEVGGTTHDDDATVTTT